MDFWYPSVTGGERSAGERQFLSLSDLITLVSNELREAQLEATQQRVDQSEAPVMSETPVMKFKECQLEMAVEVATTGSGEVSIHVFTLGGERTKTNTNTISITFEALENSPPLVYLKGP